MLKKTHLILCLGVFIASASIQSGFGAAVEFRQCADNDAARHQKVALSHAEKYYRYEERLGSNAVSVTSLKFEPTETTAVQGWLGRYRTPGKVYIEFYDSKGRSYSRATHEFEVLTEEKDGGRIEVVDFTKKS